MVNNWTHSAYAIAIKEKNTKLLKRFCTHQYPITNLDEFFQAFLEKGALSPTNFVRLCEAIDSKYISVQTIGKMILKIPDLEGILRFADKYPDILFDEEIDEQIRRKWFTLFRQGNLFIHTGYKNQAGPLLDRFKPNLRHKLLELAKLIFKIKDKYKIALSDEELELWDLEDPMSQFVIYDVVTS